MKPHVDLTGRRFGRLVVSGLHSVKPVHWNCRCDCGGTTIVRAGNLTEGNTRSCGCLRREAPWMRGDDLNGLRFGKLVVLGLRSRNPAKWACRCDCGTEKAIFAASLKNGGTKSCGCGRSAVEDLAGRRFGKLVARGLRSRNPTIWDCLCDCGTEKAIRASNLKNGNSRSCGCSRRKPRKPKLSGAE